MTPKPNARALHNARSAHFYHAPSQYHNLVSPIVEEIGLLVGFLRLLGLCLVSAKKMKYTQERAITVE